MLLFTTSCSDDNPVDNEIDSNAEASLIALQEFVDAGASGSVEHMTLDELNAFFSKNGQTTISQQEIDDVLERRRIFRAKSKGSILKTGSCPSAVLYGDWTRQLNRTICNYFPFEDILLSIFDLVQAQVYINAFGGGSTSAAPSGIPWNGYPSCTSENFGVISYMELGTGLTTVDQDDKVLVTAAILGQCN